MLYTKCTEILYHLENNTDLLLPEEAAKIGLSFIYDKIIAYNTQIDTFTKSCNEQSNYIEELKNILRILKEIDQILKNNLYQLCYSQWVTKNIIANKRNDFLGIYRYKDNSLVLQRNIESKIQDLENLNHIDDTYWAKTTLDSLPLKKFTFKKYDNNDWKLNKETQLTELTAYIIVEICNISFPKEAFDQYPILHNSINEYNAFIDKIMNNKADGEISIKDANELLTKRDALKEIYNKEITNLENWCKKTFTQENFVEIIPLMTQLSVIKEILHHTLYRPNVYKIIISDNREWTALLSEYNVKFV